AEVEVVGGGAEVGAEEPLLEAEDGDDPLDEGEAVGGVADLVAGGDRLDLLEVVGEALADEADQEGGLVAGGAPAHVLAVADVAEHLEEARERVVQPGLLEVLVHQLAADLVVGPDHGGDQKVAGELTVGGGALDVPQADLLAVECGDGRPAGTAGAEPGEGP